MNNFLQSFWISHFDNLLAKVIAELVYHYARDYWKHLVYQASEEFAFILHDKITLLNFGLKISASCLIKTIKFESNKNLLIFGGENFLLEKCLLLSKSKDGVLVVLHGLSFGWCELLLLLLVAATVEHVVQEVEADWLELFHWRFLIWLSAEYRAALLRLLEIWVIWSVNEKCRHLIAASVYWFRLDKQIVVESVIAVQLLWSHRTYHSMFLRRLLILNNLFTGPLG